jgi:hypothetical protein
MGTAAKPRAPAVAAAIQVRVRETADTCAVHRGPNGKLGGRVVGSPRSSASCPAGSSCRQPPLRYCASPAILTANSRHRPSQTTAKTGLQTGPGRRSR